MEKFFSDRDSSQTSTATAPVAVRSVNVLFKSVLRLRNRIKRKISVGYVSIARRILIANEVVVLTLQTSALAGLQGNGNSRLLSAIGLRRQPVLNVDPLATARNTYYQDNDKPEGVHLTGLKSRNLSLCRKPPGQDSSSVWL